MRLTAKKLINLPVETKSGQALGKVQDFEVDIDSGIILKFFVKQGNLIDELLKKEQLIIARQQVIEITKDKMIVEDGLVPVKAKTGVMEKIKEMEDGEMVITSKRSN